MASLRNWFTGQLVTALDMIGGDTALEAGTKALATDLGFTGIYDGFAVVQHAGTPNLTVDVAAGLAYTPDGERVRAAATSNVNCAFDHLGNPTTVTTPGNTKFVDVYAVFDRIPSDPRLDAANNTVYFVQDEGFGFDVVQGAEGVSPAPPTPLADGVLLARVTLAFGTTQILNAGINSAVREDLVALTGSPLQVVGGSILAALQAIVTRYDNHVTGAGDTHSGAAMTYGGSGAWADATTVAAGTVESGLDGIVSALASTTTGNSGDFKIGVASDIGAPGVLGAATLRVRLVQLRDANNLLYNGGPAWLGSVTNPSQSVESIIDSIITDLSSVTNSGRGTGAAKIGLDAIGNFTTTSVRAYFAELVQTNAGNDGAKRVGAEAVGSLAGANVRAQLNELDTGWGKLSRANTWSGAQTFDNITASGTNKYKLASRSITRTLTTFILDDYTNWDVTADCTPRQKVNNTAKCYWVIDAPNGATLTAVTVYAQGASGHSNLPASMPQVRLFKRIPSTGNTTSFSTTTDPSGSTGSYQALHPFGPTGLTEVITRNTHRYYAEITGEFGTDSLNPPDFDVHGVEITFTTAAQDDGAG